MPKAPSMSMHTKEFRNENGEIEDWHVNMALRTLMETVAIRNDTALMKRVKKLAKEDKKDLEQFLFGGKKEESDERT